MDAISLQAVQNDIVRSVLNTYSFDTLNKVKRLLLREEKKAEATADVTLSEEEICCNFDQACKELKLSLDGKLELKSLEEALHEL